MHNILIVHKNCSNSFGSVTNFAENKMNFCYKLTMMHKQFFIKLIKTAST